MIAPNVSMSMQPAHVPPSAWIGHLPFAFWVVEETRPRMLVELGSHHGTSYLGFCQAVVHCALDTKCFAVDTWKGDEHSGLYGDEVFQALSHYNQAHYGGFSQLLRMTFDEALSCFADGSIDLLHIDGLHTYDAVKHDFEAWLPKLSDRGITLFHDTMVRERNFGVWRLWSELRERYPSFEFQHTHGLGVLLVGTDVPQSLRNLVALSKTADEVPVLRLFDALGGRIYATQRANAAEAAVAQAVLFARQSAAEAEQRLNVLKEEAQALRLRAESSEQAAADAEQRLTALGQEEEALRLHAESLKQTAAEAEQHLSKLTQEAAALCLRAESSEQAIAESEQRLKERERELMRQTGALRQRLRELEQRDDAQRQHLESAELELTKAEERSHELERQMEYLRQRAAAAEQLAANTERKLQECSAWAEQHIRESLAKSDEIDRLNLLFQVQREGVERWRCDIAQELARRQEKLEELNQMVEATFISWRWKIGNLLVGAAKSLLGRSNVLRYKRRMKELLWELRNGSDSELELLRREIAKITGGTSDRRRTDVFKADFTRQKQDELREFLDSSQELRIWGGEGRPRVSIILVLYNRAELTLACLKTIRETAPPSIEVVIVDNASSDRTGELLDRVTGSVNIIRNRENRNFLLACNQASQHCDGDYLLFLNNDAMLLPHALQNALAVFEEESKVGAVGGKIILLDGSLQEAGSIVWRDGSCYGYGRGSNPQAPEFQFRRPVDYCSGAFLLIPKAIYTKLGGFDEAYVPAYYEESDFCLRLWEQGWRVIYEPSVQILHYEFGSSTVSEQAIALQTRNRDTFVARHPQYLAGRRDPDLSQALLARHAEERPRLLYIDDRIPHTHYGSGFPRSNFAVKTLATDYDLTLFPLNFPDEEGWETVYSDIPKAVEVMKGVGRGGFAKFLRERRGYYDVVFVSRPHNMEFYAEVHHTTFAAGPAPAVVYDAEALFALRDAMQSKILNGTSIDRHHRVEQEAALTTLAHKVIAVSAAESAEFRSHGVPDVVVIGHALRIAPTPRPFAERRDILFVGNMDYDHSPNVDSIFWFLENVLPAILLEQPELRLVLVGTNKSARIAGLKNPVVQVVGPVEDLTPWYDKCRIFIAPTRFAAGIPYKVHEAAAKGIAVVCTELIRDQLGWGEPEVLSASADDPAGFAAACLRLYGDQECWEQARAGALERIVRECSEERMRSALLEVVRDAVATH